VAAWLWDPAKHQVQIRPDDHGAPLAVDLDRC
jgi:hypothetical protein